jgi:2-polyprenyl-3-methyl-5-hydroxy-6-metoxy-1,4-benzoquinol methylase
MILGGVKMPTTWVSPFYEVDFRGQKVIIDVTGSVSASLPAKRIILDLIPDFKKKDVRTILDFGAGVLRHSVPLVNEGFEVYAVEFEDQFKKPSFQKAYSSIHLNKNFKPLIFPKDFLKNSERFDLVLLCFVLQIMPLENERKRVLDLIVKKMQPNSYLLYMSQFLQITEEMAGNAIFDGCLKNLKHSKKTFYTEFSSTETLRMFESRKLTKKAVYSHKGQEQVFLFTKGEAQWPP